VGTTGIILIMKIVINTCFGGYNLSHEAVLAYCKLKNIQVWPEKDDFYWNYWIVPLENRVAQKSHDEFYLLPLAERVAHNEAYVAQTFNYRDIARNDPTLVQIVEQLGQAAWGDLSELKVVEVPDDVDWYISEFDGKERVAERHRVWD
jgi:hypothetical protein